MVINDENIVLTKWVNPKNPYSFRLGENKIVKAMDLAISTMTKGEVCKVTATS